MSEERARRDADETAHIIEREREKELRRIDVDIANRICGRPVQVHMSGEHHWIIRPLSHEVVPEYSSDIASAWKVVEEAELRGWKVTYRTRGLRTRRVEIEVPNPDGCGAALYAAEADTVPLAICKAALQAAQPEDEE